MELPKCSDQYEFNWNILKGIDWGLFERNTEWFSKDNVSSNEGLKASTIKIDQSIKAMPENFQKELRKNSKGIAEGILKEISKSFLDKAQQMISLKNF